MAKARVEIELLGEKEVATRLNQIAVAQQRLNKANADGRISAEQLARSTAELNRQQQRVEAGVNTNVSGLRKAGDAMRRLTADQRQGAEAAQLLGARLGVQLPRSVNNLIAQSKLLGPALNLAFGAGAVLAFGAAIGQLVLPKLQELHESLTGIKELTQTIQTAAKASVSEVNNLLKASGATLDEQIRNLDNVLALLKSRGRDLLGGGFDDFDVRADQLRRLNQAVKVAEEMRDKLKEIQLQRDPIAALKKELGSIAPELIPVIANIRGTAEELGKAKTELGDLNTQLNEFTRLQAKRELEDMEKAWEQSANTLNAFNEELREHRDFLIFLKNFKLPPSALAEPNPALLKQLIDLERDYQIQRAELEGRTVDSILLQEARRTAETLSGLAKLGASEEQLAQARTILNEQAGLKIQQVNKQLFDQLSQQIDSFFQQVFLTARSFGDVWRQLTQQMVRLFVTGVSRMVAAWLLGMRQMSGAAAGGAVGSGGGILGGILGGIFGPATGGPGGLFGIAGPGGTAVFNPAGVGAISAGAGIGIAPTLPAAGGGGGSATNLARLGGLGGALTQLLPIGALLGGASLLGSGISSGSPLRGALGGGLLGAGGLLGLSALAGSGAGGLTGLIAGAGLAGPLGLAVVGIAVGIGALLGALSRGKKKKKASRIAEAGFKEMRKVVDEFRRFQVDFEGALAGVDSIWLEMQTAWRQLGGSIFRRSVRGELPEYQSIRKEIETLQQTREARGGLLRALPIPEFAAGGFVSDSLRVLTSGQGKLLAYLHGGEAVLNRGAVAALGRNFIESANRAPSFQSGGFTSGAPAPGSFVLKVERGAIVVNGVSDPERAAELTFQKLERWARRKARDKGLPAPW